MENSMARILTQTLAKKALTDIKKSPERGIRNLIDMGVQFSSGRFQKNFFSAVQTMLKAEDSAYYALVRDIIDRVDTDRLLSFGMTLGYDGCTEGASRIRSLEAAYHFNIPWVITLQIDSDFFLSHQQQYLDTIKSGNKLGICSWMLFSDEQPGSLLPLISANSDNTFFLFCHAEDITPEFLDELSPLYNLMLVVQYEENIEESCNQLRKAGLIYSIYYSYSENDITEIANGDLFCSIQEFNPAFAVLLAKEDCSASTQKAVYRIIRTARKEQQFKTIPWELFLDNQAIDEIISDDSCTLFFDSEGYAGQRLSGIRQENCNLTSDSLFEILQQVFPKSVTPAEKKLAFSQRISG
jgi:hypothetical protein